MKKMIKSKVRLDLFDKKKNLDRGKPFIVEAIWHIMKMIFFLSYFPWPQKLKASILTLFGAKVGKGVNFQPNINIHFPWRLEIGDYSWVGINSILLNFEKLKIGSNVAIAHNVFLCCGNHDFRDITYSYKNQPIIINDGVVIGSNVFVAPNVEIGIDSVITAGSVVLKSIPSNMICSGNPCVPIKKRWKDE